MNTIPIATPLFALLLLFATFGALVAVSFIGLAISVWRDDRRARKAKDREYDGLYDNLISYVELRLR